MLTRLENILTFKRYEKWKVGENLGSNAHPCYIRIRVITNRVISRFKCIIFSEAQLNKQTKQIVNQCNNNRAIYVCLIFLSFL